MTEESSSKKNDGTATSEDVEVTEVTQTPISKPPVTKGSLIIRVVIIVALAYYGVTEFVLVKDKSADEQAQAAPKPRNKRRKSSPVVEKVAVAPAEVKKEEKKEEVVEVKKEEVVEVDVKKEEPPAPVENISVAKNEDKIDPAPVAESPSQLPVKESEKEFDKKIDQLIDNENKQGTSAESKRGEVRERRKNEVDLQDKIAVEEVYLEPPSFDQLGRGLVYNCKEKHWACLSKAAYVQCAKNMKWNSNNSKKSECAVVNVYSSNEDCEKVQKYNISTGQSTSFCKP
jgi:hypothetical protein